MENDYTSKRQFECSKDVCFDTVIKILSNIDGFTMGKVDKAASTISAKNGATLLSWGENITIKFFSINPNVVEVSVVSSSKVASGDIGSKNKKNVTYILDTISRNFATPSKGPHPINCSMCGNLIIDVSWPCPSCGEASHVAPGTPPKSGSVPVVAQSALNFQANKNVGGYLEIDENAERWRILPDKYKIHQYSDIVNVEMLESGGSVSFFSNLGSLGTSLLALSGNDRASDRLRDAANVERDRNECSSLRLKITLNDFENPVVYIEFLKSQCAKDSKVYHEAFQNAQKCVSAFQIMKSIADSKKVPATTTAPAVVSVGDELLKLKTLLDSGILTAEEFDFQKKKLLGI